MTAQAICESVYKERYKSEPKAVSQAPGRVEVLGNHTDYNGGYVFSVAIDKTVIIQAEPRDDSMVTLYSIAMDDETTFSLNDIQQDPAHIWSNYLKGVLVQLKNKGVKFGGFRVVIGGDLPIGGGISSSAALEAATALIVKALYPYQMETMEMAKLCRAAENEFVGMPCGLLDQFSSFFGKKDSFLCLDCQSLEHQSIALSTEAPQLVLCDSGVIHELVETEYRDRRAQCEGAASVLGERLGRPVKLLRDISMQEFTSNEDVLDEVQRMRARHVFFENQRVQQGIAAVKVNDLNKLGELMYQSHQSSRDLFENSCPELDWLVEQAVNFDGCYGSRLTGGGFAGWTVNLIQRGRVDQFIETITTLYEEHYGRPCKTMICGIGDGARIIKK